MKVLWNLGWVVLLSSMTLSGLTVLLGLVVPSRALGIVVGVIRLALIAALLGAVAVVIAGALMGAAWIDGLGPSSS